MLPKPRLVCQEPGLQPIRRSSGVSDKSSRGLGSMCRYSAQILIYIIHFPISKILSGWGGSSAVVEWACSFQHCYCDQIEAPAKANEVSWHPLLGGQALKFCWDGHMIRIVTELEKLTDKMDKIHNHVEIINPGIKWRESLFIHECFHWISPQFPVLCQQLDCNKVTTECLDALKFDFESLFQTVKHQSGETWRWNADWGPKFQSLRLQCS